MGKHKEEIVQIPNCPPLRLNYANALFKVKSLSPEAMRLIEGNNYHELCIKNNEMKSMEENKSKYIQAIYDAVEDAEIIPFAYRCDEKKHRFLVHNCAAALFKLFSKNLRIQMRDGQFATLKVNLNVCKYLLGQITAETKIAHAVSRLWQSMGNSGILNLSNFAANMEFEDIYVNLQNRGILKRVCKLIYSRHDIMRSIKGLDLKENNMTSLEPFAIFEGTTFKLLDLRNNQLYSAKNLARDLAHVKADELLLSGNPVTQTVDYIESLKPILSNFKKLDDIPAENFTDDYNPRNIEMAMNWDGFMINTTNKFHIQKFANSDAWHGVLIPDPDKKYTKDTIIKSFFDTISEKLSPVFPCYYEFVDGIHQFLVRECFDQLVHLVEVRNLTINLSGTQKYNKVSVSAEDLSNLSDTTISYKLHMNIRPFKMGHIYPRKCLEDAIMRRYDILTGVLDLEDFQNTEGLVNIVVYMRSAKVLATVLKEAAMVYHDNIIELRIAKNNISYLLCAKSLSLMQNLKILDLSDNDIVDIEDIQDLEKFNVPILVLRGNPVCEHYKTVYAYAATVRKYLPGIKKLDDIEIDDGLISLTNYYCNMEAYDFMHLFVKKYFSTFDSGKHKVLEDTYHSNAMFQIRCAYETNVPLMVSRLEPYKTTQAEQIGSKDIAKFFKNFPNTSHNLLSFKVDFNTFNKKLCSFTISGTFCDLGTGYDSEIIIAFTRSFVLMSIACNQLDNHNTTEYKIVSDLLIIYEPSKEQLDCRYFNKSTIETPAKTVLEKSHKNDLLKMFQNIVKLNNEWCEKALESGDWDMKKALQWFVDCYRAKEIPASAYLIDTKENLSLFE